MLHQIHKIKIFEKASYDPFHARTVLLTETTSQMALHILEPGCQDIRTN